MLAVFAMTISFFPRIYPYYITSETQLQYFVMNTRPIMKRLISILLALALLCGAFLVLPGCDWFNRKKPGVPTTYPYVFVHGLNGFGDDTGNPVSYWGATGGPLLPALEAQGAMCFAPSVNPVGSAWDRACELYAALAGGVVDYGPTHSARHNHEQYGQDYGEPLFPDWGTVDENGNLRKVNLIAHSFGGATARLLCALLHNGAPEELTYTGQAPASPLFTGGKGDWVFSLTCVAAPHNGVSLLTIVDVNPLLAGLAALLDGADTNGVLSGLGFFLWGGMGLGEVLRAAKTMDTAYYDLGLAGAREVNALTRDLCPDTYLFSYPVSGTDGSGKPTDDMTALYRPLGMLIGNFTSPENGIDDAWRPNDCLVNTISATYPFGEPHEAVADPTTLTPANLKPAAWYVMPTTRGDHGSVIGLGRELEETAAFYSEMIARVDGLSKYVTG
jgi:triacylglycerol lipase